MIAERCCAALGDTARAMYLRKVNEAVAEVWTTPKPWYPAPDPKPDPCLGERLVKQTRNPDPLIPEVRIQAEREGMSDGTEHFLVKAKMATLDKNFDRASQVLTPGTRNLKPETLNPEP